MKVFLNEGEEVSISLKELSELLRQEIAPALENEREEQAIIKQLLSHYFKLDLSDFVLNPVIFISSVMQRKLLNAVSRLKQHEPLQYVMEVAYFAGNFFRVTPDVLIPRPETEEWVLYLMRYISNPASILDIGTGSGCIAISLKKQFPQAVVDAVDVSKAALAVAHYNAKQLCAQVNFIEVDILSQCLPSCNWSLIVSNPPYVRIQEKGRMLPNVLAYEPHVALFVDDHDPLLFYRRIIQLASCHLEVNGILCLEINEALSKNIIHLLYCASFRQMTLHKDMNEKERWIIAVLDHKHTPSFFVS